MKILVIQQKMIGDVLVSSIICNNLRMAYPDAQIDYLVYESTTPVLEGNPAINNIVLFKKKHRQSNWALLQLAWQIRQQKYDLLIDAYGKLESYVFVLLGGAKRRISYAKAGRHFLFTDNVPFAEFPKTNMGLAIERRLSLLKPLALNIELDPLPKLYVTEAENAKARALFEKNGVKSNLKTVMVSLLGSEKSKTYPLAYMAELVDAIADRHEVNILFNYFPSQMADARKVFEACKKSTQQKIYFDLLGDDLRGFIAIMNNCDLIVGNDGGAINMAKSLGKSSFIIFSPWIEKKIWSTFEDGIHHLSVHLQEFKPELFEDRSEKELKALTPELYPKFLPELFLSKMLDFLAYNLGLVKAEPLKIVPVRLPLSALIITYNEENHIAAVMEDLGFTDEIIVVDSYSTDQTPQIVAGFGKAKFIQNKFVDYTSQRNFAIDAARNPWILFLDADERLTDELKDEIIETIQKKDAKSAYLFYRTFIFENRKLRFSGWQTDKIFRLFQKDKARYTTERLVHEKLTVKGAIGKLKHRLIHFSYTDYESYKSKMVSYGKFKAKEEFLKGVRPNFYHFYLHPAYKFMYQFVIRLGFLDGKKGVIICYLNALSVTVRYRELKKMRAESR
ncbi:glycosyltransferase [Flavobacterium caeni]|uniref:ADP-heptose:LPS heptosyltransferase n=1 Tax=Flavobacterium caeni TaxID=490189 RepID=A0A1G5AWU5_9FLAO|nr:glycosyltransferase [Flavobacterium caeni]SCX82331.1 ADP-heptose:LPS heptosyltransferase [Flavobacterium caeni]